MHYIQSASDNGQVWVFKLNVTAAVTQIMKSQARLKSDLSLLFDRQRIRRLTTKTSDIIKDQDGNKRSCSLESNSEAQPMPIRISQEETIQEESDDSKDINVDNSVDNESKCSNIETHQTTSGNKKPSPGVLRLR